MYVWELVLLSIIFVFTECLVILWMDTSKDKGLYIISVMVTFMMVFIQSSLYWDKEIQNVIGWILTYGFIALCLFNLAGGEKKKPYVSRIMWLETVAAVILTVAMFPHFDKKVISDRSLAARNKLFLEYNYDSEEQGLVNIVNLLKNSGKTDDEIIETLTREFGLDYNEALAYTK